METQANDPVTGLDEAVRGLTKREYFAAMALQGMLSWEHGYTSERVLVDHAVEYADELIKALNQSSPPPSKAV